MEIILIKYNLPEYENKLIKQIKKHSNAKLTIFDNFEKKENIAVVWNRLIKCSKSNKICLLNTDTEIDEDFDKLFEVLDRKEVGAVGPITNNCGTIQKTMDKRDSIHEINDLSGFCYLFRKEVWEEVGGFPEDMPFYGQESIFNRKLQDRGYKLMVDRRVYVHHYKGKSYEKHKKDKSDQSYGAFHYWNYESRLKLLRQAVDNKFKIAVIGGGRGNPFPLHKGMEQAIEEMFGSNGLVLSAGDNNIDALQNFNPDLCLCIQTGWHENLANAIEQAKKQGSKTVLYYNDLRCPQHDKWSTPYTHTLESYFDYAFIGNTEFINDWKEKLKVQNVYYMPQGSLQHPKPINGKHYKHIHIGGYSQLFHENRRLMFDRIGETIDIIHLNAKGDGNNDYRDERIKIQNESYGDYHSSDFSWGISPESKMYTSDRLYNILCAGGCAIHYKPEGMERVFEHKKHLYWFNSPQEALDIVDNSSEEEREKIKDNAFKHAQKHHLYKLRLLNMLSNIYTDDKTYWGYLSCLKNIGK